MVCVFYLFVFHIGNFTPTTNSKKNCTDNMNIVKYDIEKKEHLETIKSLQFQNLSSKQTRFDSVVEIKNHNVYSKEIPVQDGPNDFRMGPTDRRLKCGTCGNSIEYCSGHTGHIEFPLPVYRPNNIEILVSLLNSFCYCCFNFRANISNENNSSKIERLKRYSISSKNNKKTIFDYVCKMMKKNTCENCGKTQPDFKKNGLWIIIEWNHMKIKKQKQKLELKKLKDLEKLNNEKKTNKKKAKTSTKKKFQLESHTSELSRQIEQENINPVIVQEILFQIKEEYFEWFGFRKDNSIKNAIIYNMVVVAPCIRPDIKQTHGSKTVCQDNLTSRLSDILKHRDKILEEMKNKFSVSTVKNFIIKNFDEYHKRTVASNFWASLLENMNMESLLRDLTQQNESIRPIFDAFCEGKLDIIRFGNYLYEIMKKIPFENYWLKLQNLYTMYVDHELVKDGLKQDYKHQPTRSLMSVQKGKKGRLRLNISGVRVNYTSRCVITPDSNINCDDIGVPIYICMRMSYPENVTRINKDKMQKFVENGDDIYPGAMLVVKKNNQTLKLSIIDKKHRKKINLEYGDIVHRHLIKGDPLIVNRQPSLHQGSIMCHKCVPLPGNTFRLHQSVCGSYGADFDGFVVVLVIFFKYFLFIF